MTRLCRGFMKFAVAAGVGATLLQSTCSVQLRDAALVGLTGFVTDAVRLLLDSIVTTSM